ncbi:MAG TPA: folylpolyglutamate synthase/dihydrofolate synthase family protein [Myxococcota bacterium]
MAGPKRTRRIDSEAAASAYLAGLINVEKERNAPYSRFDLGPIRRLTERLGNPQAGLSVIHLAGSKGKGSTGLMAEALLGAAGERVGTFTSPHLERWNERFRIDGREVAGELLAAAVERIAPHIDELRAADPLHAPSFFDALTATALLLFSEAKLDRCVFEVGLGGRLDSTNAMTAAVSCITSIELEHTQQLGDTLAAIASEKAGILKSGVPAVIGDLPDEAAGVIEARARELGAPLARLGRDFDFEILDRDLEGQSIRLTDGPLRVDARIAALGSHQARNAALALACAARAPGCVRGEQLIKAAERGFAAVHLPGRIELIGRAPWMLVDSAHTGSSAAALAEVLQRIPRRRSHLVLSISAGKDADAILRNLLPEVNAVTVTRADPIRSLPPSEVAKAIRAAAPGVLVRVVPNPHLALRAAREALGAEDLLCVSGSIYLAGIARRVLSNANSNERVAVSRRSGED